jgi:hypothetical protein
MATKTLSEKTWTVCYINHDYSVPVASWADAVAKVRTHCMEATIYDPAGRMVASYSVFGGLRCEAGHFGQVAECLSR